MSALDNAGSQEAMHAAFAQALGAQAPFIDRKLLDRALSAVAETVKREAREAFCRQIEAVRDDTVIEVKLLGIKIKAFTWGQIGDRVMKLLTGSPCPERS